MGQKLKKEKGMDQWLNKLRLRWLDSEVTNYEFVIRHLAIFPLGSHAAHFFAKPLARQSLLDALLFARFHIERMFFDILDDVFLLNLALEASKSTFEGFTFIQNDFRHSDSPPLATSGQFTLSPFNCQDLVVGLVVGRGRSAAKPV